MWNTRRSLNRWSPYVVLLCSGLRAWLTPHPQALKAMNLRPAVLNGDVSARERAAIIDRFAQPAGLDVLLISRVANNGINLASAHVLILMVGRQMASKVSL
jgi:superfamily II DNA or RNA helicase